MKRETDGPSSLLGYKLRTRYNVTVPRDMVTRILRELDPDASALRRTEKLQRRSYVSPGPNATWHVDAYGKLKPYGFLKHACVDGFSRRIMWNCTPCCWLSLRKSTTFLRFRGHELRQ